MMISVSEAKRYIEVFSAPLGREKRKLTESLHFVLAEDILAPFSLPSFRQSSMDGYAVYAEDIAEKGTILQIVGEAKAGAGEVPSLERGQAIRIFTGAPVPQGATAVVMQEHTRKLGDQVMVDVFPVAEGKNIRQIGQQILQGAVALPAQTLLTAGAIGFLTGLNVQEVEVMAKPKIGLLITGDELVQQGEALAYGQVYESNSAMLRAALQQEGIASLEIQYAPDSLAETVEVLQGLSERNNLVLASGGISVGDYDFVGKALEMIEAETIFYKVKQKPGKPLLFAKKGSTLFFALPGNPASSLVCYYEYVLPAIRKMSGRSDYFLRKCYLPVTTPYQFDGERDEFLKALATEDSVMPLDGQESFALRSFALANALIYLPDGQNKVEIGDCVEVHLLPN